MNARARAGVALMCGAIAGLASHVAVADSSPLGEAMQRGLVGKPPAAQKLSAERFNREQRAAFDRSEAILHRALQEPGLLAQYLFMREKYAADDNPVFRSVFGQYLAWFQTWIGDDDGARASFSIAQPAQPDDAPPPVGLRAERADAVILRLAANRQALFFNEAHHAPVTRTLTAQLLARLRAQGFTYFAAETLTRANAPKNYPTARNGFYVNEPIYGEMVRAALRLGFRVIAYDAEEGAPAAREKTAAQALYDQVFRHDPNARLIVNAGFSHIQKSGDYFGGKSMAEMFQSISGIEPLSVEQTMLIEHARADDDHPYFHAAMAREHPDAAFVFVSDAGIPWSLKPHRYDLSVFFPRERQIDGRPDWLTLGDMRKPFVVDGTDCAARFPCLLEARPADEGEDAVAVDRVLLDGNARRALFLASGNYRLSALDRAGHVITTRDIHVDVP